ncbi:4-carboxymuconolactone decarboxylase [Pelagibius marinus]|uniref:4-carboxymuconolactone decarboxylase n=1 Tax=Pelagibius marinus TaxID=2762760 RepID=UPI0018722563|nr:4-carboxymuconolactone decarboxylase [Pelagibius marinus]
MSKSTGSDDTRRSAGRKTRSEVLGEAYVAASDAKRSGFNADFLDFITEGAWGSVWSRPGLTRRERSMITIALLAAGGHFEEVAMHVRASANTGASPEDIKEALLHVAVYAGVPAANQAFKVAQQTLEEMGGDNKQGKQETRK